MFKIILLILITINIFADSKVSGEFGREEARLIFD